MEPGLLRLADEAGLAFLEVAAAPIQCGSAVVLVNPLPRLDHFASATQAKILDTLTGLLIQGPAVAPDVREART